MRFGAHVSIAGGLHNAPENGRQATCDVIQIFTKNQMQWKVPPLTQSEVAAFQAAVARTGVEPVCAHASYLINLAGRDRAKLAQSRANFLSELERAEALGLPYVVVHPGSHMGAGEGVGIRRAAESLDAVFDATPDLQTKVLLETTAGQGQNIGYTFEHLSEIKARTGCPHRVGVCLDTCHLFAAGYELRTADGYEATIAKLAAVLDLADVAVIHANDSRRERGSRVDRHAHIGEGELGLSAFAHFVRDPRFRDVPMIIETPGGPLKHAQNLAKLRALQTARSAKYSPNVEEGP